MVDGHCRIAPSGDLEAMATLLVEEIRRRHILLPSIAVLELIGCHDTTPGRGGRERALTQGLSGRHSSHWNGSGWRRDGHEPTCLVAHGLSLAGAQPTWPD